jgi:hypothetical protein
LQSDVYIGRICMKLLKEDTDESREIWANLRSGREAGQNLDL